jgi:hypothetical protein
MKKFSPIFALLIFFQANAQTPTWSDDIAKIVYDNCSKCHHNGGLAPFSLMTYSEAYNNRFGISTSVSDKKMPPWPPSPSYRHYKDERNLTTDQIIKINAWANNGAPEGNASNAPTPPVFTNGSALGNVDLTLTIPSFTVPNVNYDLYQCFTIPTNLTTEQFISAIEVVPGDPTIVHHVLIYEDTSGQSVTLDNASPEPGYTSFGGVGFNAQLVGGWVPGQSAEVYPSGMGVKLHKNAHLVLQIHYPNGSSGKTDSTKVNIKLNSGSLREIFIAPPINHSSNLIGGPLNIAPNQVKTYRSEYNLPTNPLFQGISVLNVAPHAHLICTKWLVFAITPTNDTIPFIQINDWDFHWQGFYTLQQLVHLTAGTKIIGLATYDNTSNNPHNPNNPPQTVTAGEATEDEMMLCYFSYLFYQSGDENMVIDSSILEPQPTGLNSANNFDFINSPQLYEAIPNPSNQETTIGFYLPKSSSIQLQIHDLNGRLVREVKQNSDFGLNYINLTTSNIAPGTYIYSLTTAGKTKAKRLSITH